MTTDPLSAVSKLNQQQKEDLERLWKTQTNDAQDGGSVLDRTKQMDKDSHFYITRLHAFFLCFLKKHTKVESNGQTNDKEGGAEKSHFLKDNLRESCLDDFFSRFVETGHEQGSSEEKRIWLNGEKSVFMLHYDEFLSELNQYEYKGGAVCPKGCFGAFLYHRPIDALPVLNVSMALSVITLWRLRNNAFSGREAATTKTNHAAKVNRFLDFCRIQVRFVHVKPQLPMAEIKTGLLKKLITVKGHVVKARPRRLRVITADL